jgi:hypothetical protein
MIALQIGENTGKIGFTPFTLSPIADDAVMAARHVNYRGPTEPSAVLSSSAS